MTRDEKIRLIAGLRSGRIKPEDLQPPDLTQLTNEEMLRIIRIKRDTTYSKTHNPEDLSPEDRKFLEGLVEAHKTRPAYYGYIDTLKEGLAAGKTLKQIAGDFHIEWQDTAPVEKLIEYCKQNEML